MSSPTKSPTHQTPMRTHRTYTTTPPLIFLLALISACVGAVLLVIAFVLLRAVIPSMQVGPTLVYGIIAGGVGLTLVCAAWSIVGSRRSGGAAILFVLISGGVVWLLYPLRHTALTLGRPDAIQFANYDQAAMIHIATIVVVITLSLAIYWQMIKRRRDEYYSRPYVARYAHPREWGQAVRSHIRSCFRWQTVIVFLMPYILLIIGGVAISALPLITQTIGGNTPTDLGHAVHTARHTPHALSLDAVLSWEAITGTLLISIIALIVLTQFYNYLIISDRPSSTHQTIRNQLFTTRRPIPWILCILIIGSWGAGYWHSKQLFNQNIVPTGYFTTSPLLGTGDENGYNHIAFLHTDYLDHTYSSESRDNGYFDIGSHSLIFENTSFNPRATGAIDLKHRIDHLVSSGVMQMGGPTYNFTGALNTHKSVFNRFALTTRKYAFDSYTEPFNLQQDSEIIKNIDPHTKHFFPLTFPPSVQNNGDKITDRYKISLVAAAIHCYRGDEQTCIGIIKTLYHHIDQRYAFSGTLWELGTTLELDRKTTNATILIVNTLSISDKTKNTLIDILRTHTYDPQKIYKRTMMHEYVFTKSVANYAQHIHTTNNITSLYSLFAPTIKNSMKERYYCHIEHHSPNGCSAYNKKLLWRISRPLSPYIRTSSAMLLSSPDILYEQLKEISKEKHDVLSRHSSGP